MSDGVYICYVPKDFTKAHLQVIEWVEDVLSEYAGYTLTVRQLYYQLVAKDLIKNNYNSYKRISDIINDGRLAGVLPWDAFEDRGRNLMGYETVSGPNQAMSNMIKDFKLDLWAKQSYRPEVWVEKQALEGVIGEICGKLRVDFYATKGYNSQSEQWRAGKRFSKYIRNGQTPIIFHFGDHDPSGRDMTRDNRDRLSMFAGVPITVVRLALNMDQIEQYNPPANFVKVRADGEFADSRAKAYVEEFGHESWELDALSPRVIHEMIEENVLRLRDQELWDEAMQEEVTDIERMSQLVSEMGGSDDGE